MAQNYYKLFKTPKVRNPGFNLTGIQLPARILLIGQSGSGKTNWLLDYISKTSGTFENIYIFCRCKEEPLYNYLESKIPEGLFFIEVSDENDITPLNDLERNSLIVFDDLVLLKRQDKIGEYFIRSRKFNDTCIFLSQSYFSVSKIIRQQCNYIILKKINSSKDLSLILSEFPLDMSLEQLKYLYNQSINKGIESFIMIDINNNSININYKKQNK